MSIIIRKRYNKYRELFPNDYSNDFLKWTEISHSKLLLGRIQKSAHSSAAHPMTSQAPNKTWLGNNFVYHLSSNSSSKSARQKHSSNLHAYKDKTNWSYTCHERWVKERSIEALVPTKDTAGRRRLIVHLCINFVKFLFGR